MAVSENKKVGLGNVLKLLRIARNLSIKDLASELGVSASYVGEVEANNKKPNLDMLSKYSKALNISRSSIMYFDEKGEDNGYDHEQLLYIILQKIVGTSDDKQDE